MGPTRTGLMILMAVVRACCLLLPGPMATVSARPQASRTHEAMASLPQLSDRMAAMRKFPGRLLAGLSASVTGWRAKRDDSSCDLLFDDEDHAATWYVYWYVYKASSPARVHRVAKFSSSTLG